jgi:hypothetical protein
MPMDWGLARDYAARDAQRWGDYFVRSFAMTDSIQQRINQLERDKRWWKRVAIGFMVVFSIILLGGGVTSFTLARQAREQALKAEQLARQAQIAVQGARQLQPKMEREVEKSKR